MTTKHPPKPRLPKLGGVVEQWIYADMAVAPPPPTFCSYCRMDFTDLDVIDHGMHASCYEWTQVAAKHQTDDFLVPSDWQTTVVLSIFPIMVVVILGILFGWWG